MCIWLTTCCLEAGKAGSWEEDSLLLKKLHYIWKNSCLRSKICKKSRTHWNLRDHWAQPPLQVRAAPSTVPPVLGWCGCALLPIHHSPATEKPLHHVAKFKREQGLNYATLMPKDLKKKERSKAVNLKFLKLWFPRAVRRRVPAMVIIEEGIGRSLAWTFRKTGWPSKRTGRKSAEWIALVCKQSLWN